MTDIVVAPLGDPQRGDIVTFSSRSTNAATRSTTASVSFSVLPGAIVMLAREKSLFSGGKNDIDSVPNRTMLKSKVAMPAPTIVMRWSCNRASQRAATISCQWARFSGAYDRTRKPISFATR